MKKTQLIKLITLILVLTMAIPLFACKNGGGDSAETESQTQGAGSESNEAQTTESENSSESETESESESDGTTVNPNTIVYNNGTGVDNSGDGLSDDAFALTQREINESAATAISAAELVTLLKDKNALKADDVYRVTEPIVLEANTKYYGNLATVIADAGIIIKNADGIVIKELVIKGSIKIESSSSITLFRLDITSDSVGISADDKSSDISIKSCRINAADTAIDLGASLVSLYQNYLSADKGIVSSGSDITAQSNRIYATSLGVASSGAYCTFRNNSIDAAVEGIGIDLSSGSYNCLVALNDISNVQLSIRLSEAYNCSVILNNAIRLEGVQNKNVYFIDNVLGGAIELSGNQYLICDGNSFPEDGKPHPVNKADNKDFNGDNMHDVNARLDVGADENLLPHTNKDLFLGMERRSNVKDLSQTKSYDLNNYIRNIAKNEKVVIVPPGAYSINSTLNLQAAHSNTTIYAYGVYHEATDYIKNLGITGTTNLKMKGITIGYSKQSAGQAQVVEVMGNLQLRLITSAGHNPYGQFDTTGVQGKTNFYCFSAGEMCAWTEFAEWGAYEVVPNENGELMAEDGTFIIKMKNANGYKDVDKYYTLFGKGDVFASRLVIDNDRTVSISNATNILFMDTVTYGYADALCFVIGGTSKGVQFYRHHNTAHSAYEIDKETYDHYVALENKYDVDLEVYIDEEGRYRGANPRFGSVDATHITGASQGLSATSTLFENACDDSSNQNGGSSALHQVIDNLDGTLTLVLKDSLPETYYNSYINQGKTQISPGHCTRDFVTGDRIFVYASNGKIFCDTTVVSDSKTVQTGVVVLEKEYTYQGEKRVLQWASKLVAVKVRKADVDMSALEGYDLQHCNQKFETKVIVDNISRNSTNFVFDNCMSRDTYGRFVIKTRDAVITNCTLKNTCLAGIVLSVECTWGESSVPSNITVTKCLFESNGQKFDKQNNTKFAALAVEGLGDKSAAVTVSENTIPCKNITITGNVFRDCPNNYYLTVQAVQGVTIADNVFEERDNESSKKIGKAVYINGCMNVNVSNNTYSDFAEGDVSKVVIGNNYKNLFGTDVEGVLDTDKIPEEAN